MNKLFCIAFAVSLNKRISKEQFILCKIKCFKYLCIKRIRRIHSYQCVPIKISKALLEPLDGKINTYQSYQRTNELMNPNLFAVGNGFGFFVSLHETA